MASSERSLCCDESENSSNKSSSVVPLPSSSGTEVSWRQHPRQARMRIGRKNLSLASDAFVSALISFLLLYLSCCCSGFGPVASSTSPSTREHHILKMTPDIATTTLAAAATDGTAPEEHCAESNNKNHSDEDNGFATACCQGEATGTAYTHIETRFVLLETRHPGNVGASARSMKTMGFNDGLVLIRPGDDRVLGRKKCKEAASGAGNVLEGAILVLNDGNENDGNGGNNNNNATSLVDKAMELAFAAREEQPNDNDQHEIPTKVDSERDYPLTTTTTIVCGTGMPVDMGRERVAQRYVEPRIFFDELLRRKEPLRRTTATTASSSSSANHANATAIANEPMASTTSVAPATNECERHELRIAFLFGNEKHGMTPQDTEKCDVMLGIPTNPEFGSLNLATAVQIIAYDWRQALGGFPSPAH